MFLAFSQFCTHVPGPLPGVPAEYVPLGGLDEDVVPPDVVQDVVRRGRRQVGQGVTLRLRARKEACFNGRDSFQLFVGVFDTCPVCYLLVLPSETHAVVNMTSLRAIDGDTSYHSCESFSLGISMINH